MLAIFARLKLPFLLLICTVQVSADLVTVQVDDTDPRITYSASTSWNYGPDCTVCTAHPDPGQMFNHTWHDTTANTPSHGLVNVSFSFVGSAVNVYCALPPGTYPTDMTFYIDGDMLNTFSSPLSDEMGFQYQQLVYSSESLPNGQHTLAIVNGLSGEQSLMLLDYITFIQDSEIPLPASASLFAESSSSSTESSSSSSATLSMQQPPTIHTSNFVTVHSMSSEQSPGFSISTPSLAPPPISSSAAVISPSDFTAPGSTSVTTILSSIIVSPSQPASSVMSSSSTTPSPAADIRTSNGLSNSEKMGIGVGIGVAVGLLFSSLIIFCFIRRRRRPTPSPAITTFGMLNTEEYARIGAATSQSPETAWIRDRESAIVLLSANRGPRMSRQASNGSLNGSEEKASPVESVPASERGVSTHDSFLLYASYSPGAPRLPDDPVTQSYSAEMVPSGESIDGRLSERLDLRLNTPPPSYAESPR